MTKKKKSAVKKKSASKKKKSAAKKKEAALQEEHQDAPHGGIRVLPCVPMPCAAALSRMPSETIRAAGVS
jgi:hypothetical protein